MSRLHHSPALWAILAAAALLGASCGSTQDTGTSTAGSTTTTAPAATSAPAAPGSTGSTDVTPAPTTLLPEPTTDGIDPMPTADQSTKSAAFTGTAVTHLTDVRIARHEGYDRVVFSFDGDVPGYEVGYVDPPILADGSGEPVAVAGGAYLRARFEPASGVDLDGPDYREVYTGPDTVTGDTSVLIQVVRTGDFEAVLTWVAGIAERQDFRVTILTSPARVVVDVRNH
jgi:hypothetical protein